jgi:hypothetical protein
LGITSLLTLTIISANKGINQIITILAMSKKKIGKNNSKFSKNTTFKFKSYQHLGSPDAETDNNLNEVFVDNGAHGVLADPESPKCIIIGRTGSGKSALIKKLKETEVHITTLNPEQMSLAYLTNSTILNYLRELNVSLGFFYKVLWKHVFIVEILKLYLGEDSSKKQSVFQKLWNVVSTGGKGDESKKLALEYFNKWSDEFWLTTEYRIKTLEQELEQKVQAELGVDFKSLKFGSSNFESLGEKVEYDVKNRAESVINQVQGQSLLTLIELLSKNVFNNLQRKYYLVIDDLDKEWASPQIVYDLIGSMIEVIKEFQQKFKGVKIIIALRENLQMKIFSGTAHRGGQREKFTPLFLNLSWSNENLKKLIDLRIQHVTNKELSLDSIFGKQSREKSGLDYVIERTYMRPRDIISYFNKIIEASSQKSHFDMHVIKHAESKYSVERLQALEDEWSENFGEISKILNFLRGMHNGFNIYNIKDDAFAEIMVESEYINSFKGDLYIACNKWRNSKSDLSNFRIFLAELFNILYRIGIIGIKRRPDLPIEFYYTEIHPTTPSDFDNNIRIYVHKALYSVLKIIVKEQDKDCW